MDENVRRTVNLINAWRDRASDVDDDFLRFFILYMCLDAWMVSVSQLDRDDKKCEWVKQGGNALLDGWAQYNAGLEDSLAELKELCLIEDLRPENPSKPKSLNNADNFAEVFDVVYQVRCNLFHGGKSPDDERDVAFVRASVPILERWIDQIVSTQR